MKTNTLPKTKKNVPPVEVAITFVGIEKLRLSLNMTKKDIASLIGRSQTGYKQISRLGGPIQVTMETLNGIVKSGLLEKADMKFVDLFAGVPEHLK